MSLAPSPKKTRKPKTVSTETSGIIPPSTWSTNQAPDEIRLIPIDLIERHPANRTIRPESVRDLAESLQEHGQRDAARVRSRPDGKFTVLSGERRYQAARVAGLASLKCIVINCDDATALAEVALGNASRKDLDAIERAELLTRLMAPIADGGSGLDRLSAGKLFGLESESGVKNAVRLLELPESIRALVRSGDLPERAARRLVPYCRSQVVIDAIGKDFDQIRSKPIKSNRYEPDTEWEETILSLTTERDPCWIQDIIDTVTRPMDDGDRFWCQKRSRYILCAIPPDHPQLSELAIVELHDGKGGTARRAENLKLWEKLNSPYLELAEEKTSSSKTSKNKSASTKKPDLTEAEQRAEAKRRKAEAEDRLNKASVEFASRLLRVSLIDEASDQQILATLPWLISRCTSDLSSMIPGQRPYGKFFAEDQARIYSVWRLLIWPVANISGKSQSRLVVKPGQLPDRLPGYVSIEEIAELAKHCNVTIESAWKRAATADSDHRRLLAAWLLRHTKDQLHALRNEINCTQGSSTMGRDELADCILSEHRPGQPLPLPKRLQKKGKK